MPGNEKADAAARNGALGLNSENILVLPSYHEVKSKIRTSVWKSWEDRYRAESLDRNWIPLPLPTPQGFFFEAVPKKIADIMSRLRCGVWRTKFVPTACICNTSEISFQHCIFDCPALTNYFTETVNLTIKNRLPKSISSIANMSILGQMAKDIASSPVGSYL